MKALMAAVKTLPFCSSAAFCEAVVLELKNFSQFAVICATAVELPAVELAGAELPAAGADDDGAELDPGLVADVLGLLLQAATVAARTRPSAGAAIRRARRLNRMTRLLCLGRGSTDGCHC
jgi:hypothetical protein